MESPTHFTLELRALNSGFHRPGQAFAVVAACNAAGVAAAAVAITVGAGSTTVVVVVATAGAAGGNVGRATGGIVGLVTGAIVGVDGSAGAARATILRS